MSGSNNPFYGKKGSNQYTDGTKVMSQETKDKIAAKSKLHKHSKETKQKISESMIAAHAEGRAWNIGASRWNNKQSYPEQFFSKVIENHFEDIDYVTEYPFLIYSFDFAWPHKRKAIEIDGDQHERFEDYRLRDIRKDNLAIDHGWEVLRIKWKDIYNDPTHFICIAHSFIHS